MTTGATVVVELDAVSVLSRGAYKSPSPHSVLVSACLVYLPLTSTASIHLAARLTRVTGRGHIDINRISGYLPGKIVFFLMQVRVC